MPWRNNLLILEEILRHLDFPDLLCASAVCRAWLTASAKAFQIASCLVISDSRPDGAPDMARLQRFQRITAFKFKLSNSGGATQNGLNCILADLPLETLSTLTHVTLDYEPTAQVLEAINTFLGQLTSRFPTLKELAICPNADPAEDLVSPSLEFLRDNLVSSDDHPNLTVLRVPIGPNSGSGIDWRFLSSLKKLEHLDLLRFHVSSWFAHRQLIQFTEHFPTDVHIAKLNIHLRPGIRRYFLLQDKYAMSSAFKAINPETCTLHIEQMDIFNYWLVVDHVISDNLKRINVHYSMPITSFTDESNLWERVKELVFPLKHLQQPQQNQPVLLRIDIASEGLSISFIELECAQFEAPLVLRHGPVGPYAEHFTSFLKYSLQHWTRPNVNFVPVPRYNALRKYTFNESQQIVGLAQYYPVNEKSPAFGVWQRTYFFSDPNLSSLINGQPSWKPPLKLKRSISAFRTLNVSALLVYSIDCTTAQGPECNHSP